LPFLENDVPVPKRILITDDALFMRVTLKNLLVNSGYEVVGEAVNGLDAVQKYASSHPDVVFMDITMPVMDGIAATKAIKQQDPDAKVIMCTAMGQRNMVMEAIQAGAKDFIVKPFSPERVLESIEKVTG
jgi:two-component system chemotaxis response regulator CheY